MTGKGSFSFLVLYCTFYIIFLLFSTDCDGLESTSQGRSRQSTWRFQAKNFAKEILFRLVSNETWWLCYLQETREKVHHSKSPGHKSSQLTVKGNFTLRNPNMVHDPGTPCQWWSNLCLGRCCGCSQDSIRRFHCALYQGDNLASKKVFFQQNLFAGSLFLLSRSIWEEPPGRSSSQIKISTWDSNRSGPRQTGWGAITKRFYWSFFFTSL